MHKVLHLTVLLKSVTEGIENRGWLFPDIEQLAQGSLYKARGEILGSKYGKGQGRGKKAG